MIAATGHSFPDTKPKTYYVLCSLVDGQQVPVGEVKRLRADADAAARELNAYLPRLHVEVVEVAADGLTSQPPMIRDHVTRHLQRRS